MLSLVSLSEDKDWKKETVMTKTEVQGKTPDLDTTDDVLRRIDYSLSDYRILGQMLSAYFFVLALIYWNPDNQDDLTFRSSVLIAALGAFTLAMHTVSNRSAWMYGLLGGTIVISASTAAIVLS